ncbi:MAG: rRNA adenine N(6)-methyltransferase family protein [Candidatus Dojkabacteria bacterium]|jgi:23S rRNA (adenine-N6)-dimethyltransferase
MVDIKYSQNFYLNKTNLEKLFKVSGIDSNDTVLDIGAGTGVITEGLSKYAKLVIAYELDDRYFKQLKDKFQNNPNILLIKKDFLNTELPKKDFKIFANIPFFITSDIVNKITDVDSGLREAFLFVQKESAQRYIGKPNNTQIATILSFMFESNIIEEFRRKDFNPIPKVDIVLLCIKKKDVDKKDYVLYRDFVTYVFNQRNSFVGDTFKKIFTYKQLRYINEYIKRNNYSKPTDIPLDYYTVLFEKFKVNGDRYIDKVRDYYSKHLKQHSKREKVHRTRT